MEIQDLSPNVEREKDVEDEVYREAGEAYVRKIRPKFIFGEMNIPLGRELVCVTNAETVKVISDRTVEFRGEETSLTNATRIILDNGYHVAPGPYWTFNRTLLRTIYNNTYPANN